jgi:hypothetical protein
MLSWFNRGFLVRNQQKGFCNFRLWRRCDDDVVLSDFERIDMKREYVMLVLRSTTKYYSSYKYE